MFQFCKQIFKLQFLLILVAILIGVYYTSIAEQLGKYWFQEKEVELKYTYQDSHKNVYTRQELAHNNGDNGTPLYLALLGSVYDVSKGVKHYGPGASYNFFVGRDASVSFVTGEFETYVEKEADDVLSLKPSELLSLDHWKRFYEKDYIYKGKLIGRFYDTTGQPTTYYHKYQALLQQAKEAKIVADQLRVNYPDCNIEWSAEKGTHVWCTTTSGGGKERDWIGHPRKFYEVGSEKFRCACVRTEELDTAQVLIMIKPYENCQNLAQECYYNVD